MREVPYEAERVLQDLIAQHPQILAGEQVDLSNPRRWLLLAQEAGVPSEADGYARWSVDHLVVDQDGIPTIVEVKRSSDTPIRREVVGQMLDYAANASAYWTVSSLRSWFEERAEREGSDPDKLLAATLGLETDSEAFWDQVRRNFEGGVFRLVFVADVLPAELRRVIEYMDDQMSRTQVVGIEVRRYAPASDSAMAVLVPRVVAQSARRQVTGSTDGQSRKAGTRQRSWRPWGPSTPPKLQSLGRWWIGRSRCPCGSGSGPANSRAVSMRFWTDMTGEPSQSLRSGLMGPSALSSSRWPPQAVHLSRSTDGNVC